MLRLKGTNTVSLVLVVFVCISCRYGIHLLKTSNTYDVYL